MNFNNFTWDTLVSILGIFLVCFIFYILFNFQKAKKATKQREYLVSLSGHEAIEIFTINSLETYHRMAITLHGLFIFLGFVAIVGSIFVTTFISLPNDATSSNVKGILPVVAFLSTTSLTLITAFNLSTKSNNCRKAWRRLQNAYDIYKGEVNPNISELINARKEAEEILGGVDFQYQP